MVLGMDENKSAGNVDAAIESIHYSIQKMSPKVSSYVRETKRVGSPLLYC
jgi:hypothetical protein